MSKIIDLTGQAFGQWTVLKLAPRGAWKHGEKYWVVKCSCGLQKAVSSSTLRRGKSTQCKNCRGRVHGHCRRLQKSKEYISWRSMKQRCYDINYKRYDDYGGRGIGVCDRWKDSFENFLADMGLCPDGLTLERKENGQSYEPSNCIWATRQEQSENKRNNIYIRWSGAVGTAAQWSRKLGIHKTTIAKRAQSGWPLSEPMPNTRDDKCVLAQAVFSNEIIPEIVTYSVYQEAKAAGGVVE